jgi:nucleoside triphosphate pyrophosphatase
MGVDFKVLPSQAAELHTDDLTARELAQVNAYRKARSVAKQYPDALVLGADTLVHMGTQLFGKPATAKAAGQMLQQLQGQTHEVVTAICLLCLRHHRQSIFAESTSVTFLPLNAAAIRLYLSKVDPMDKAGAYAIQEHGDLLVEKIAGSYTNVVGLPTERLMGEFARWTIDPMPVVPLPVQSARERLSGQ